MKHRFALSLVVLAGAALVGPGAHGAGFGAQAAGGGGGGNGAVATGSGGLLGAGGGSSSGGGGAGSSFSGGGGGGGSRPSIVQPSTGGGGAGGGGHVVFDRPSTSGGGFTGSAPVNQPPINKTPLRPYIPPTPGDPADRGNPRGGGQSGAGFIPFSDDYHRSPMPRPTPGPTGHPGTAAFPVAPATAADAPWRASSLNHTSSTPGTPGTGGGGRPWHPGRTGSGASAPNPGETFINSAAIVANAPLRASLEQRAGGVQAWEARRQNYWNQWAAQHSGRLDEFASQRQDLWNRTREFRGNHWDQIRQHGDAWRQWRESMLNFRAQRGDEIRDGYRDAYCEWFTPGWFLRHRWWLNAYYVNYAVNPWWCWQGPGDFGGYTVIYNGAPPDAVTDDYGTDIVMNGDNVYVDGQDTGSAEAWRAQAIALANPAVMPPPPVPQGDNDPSMMPLGVWALTAEETGNAVIFYQLAATRDGLITGTYSNVLTGDNGPLIGSIDKKSQRLAFHAGNVTQTVVETNLNGLTRPQTAAYIHFGTAQTQEWMLVRMADPGAGGGGNQ